MTSAHPVKLLGGMRAFLDWWREELVGMVPFAWRERWSRSIPKAIIRPLATSVEVELIDGRDHRLLVDDVPLAKMDEAGWAETDAIVRSRRTVIVLSHPESLIVRTTLPSGAVGHAGRVLELQLDRLSPLKPEYIAWNWAVMPGPERAEAAVGMVKTSTIQQLDQLLSNHGVPMPAIAAAHDPAPVHILSGYDGSETPERRLDRRLDWLALGLLVSIPVTTIIGLAAARSGTLASIEALNDEVAPRLAADRRVRRAAAASGVVQPLLSRPAAGVMLGRLAELLPEGSRLASFELGTDGIAVVTIEGASAEALELLLREAFSEAIILPPEASPAVPGPAAFGSVTTSNIPRVTAELRL